LIPLFSSSFGVASRYSSNGCNFLHSK
jgi:hypothetical protein